MARKRSLDALRRKRWDLRRRIAALERELEQVNIALKDEFWREMEGDTRLTTRQKQVGRLLTRGLSNKEIAAMLHLSVRVTKFHVSKLLAACRARDRHELAAKLRETYLPLPMPSATDVIQ